MKNTESIGSLYDWFTFSPDYVHTGTTTEANEPIEVDDDVSHEASENKESFSPVGTVYTRG
jgi:hypothetical protein